MGRGWAGVLALVLGSAGCVTAPPPSPRDESELPAPIPAATPAPPVFPGDPRVESLLEAAEDAAARGLVQEFEACELLIAEALAEARERTSGAANFATYAGAVLEELERLRGALGPPETPEEDLLPEPGPVPAERLAELAALSQQETFDLPVVMRPEVASLIDFYLGPYRERLIAALGRAGRYLPFIREELARAGLPLDLAFLPLVESAFQPSARSRARAQGLWQFMAGTGRLYGLRADGLIDERNDPFLATRAAVAHLADLYAQFGDWELALAAYNSGAGRVERAIRRGGTRDFWALRRHLPRETRNYVPAMWAALVVAKDPARWGLPPIVETPVCLGRVEVEGALDLAVLGERGPLSAEELAALNPALTFRVTPHSGRYQLAVPCGREAEVAAALAAIPPAERVRRFFHVVREGDTLAAIARRYGSSVEAIMAANAVRDPRRLRVGQQLVVPRDVRRSGGASTAAPPPGPRPRRHVVQRGDTLYAIARRYGLTVAALQELNGLSDTAIRVGDVLRLDP